MDLEGIRENYERIRAFLPESVSILSVVKSNAYGHGMEKTARKLESLGISYFGVSCFEEGKILREIGINSPILVLSGFMPWDNLEEFSKLNLTAVVHNFSMIERLKREERKYPLRLHIKIDTGMGRLGFFPEEIQRLIEILKGIEKIEIEGIMSHFSSSEIRDEFGLNQVKIFKETIGFFEREGIELRFKHMANSAAIINYPEAHFNMVRIGLALYGYFPKKELEDKLRLKKAMKVKSKVAFVKEFEEGTPVSYGRTFITKRRTKVAFIPLGYGDGYPRSLSNKGFLKIKDRLFPIIGTISMDFILADVTDSEVQEGDEATLLDETLNAYEISSLVGSIPYELLCNISKGKEKIYNED